MKIAIIGGEYESREEVRRLFLEKTTCSIVTPEQATLIVSLGGVELNFVSKSVVLYHPNMFAMKGFPKKQL